MPDTDTITKQRQMIQELPGLWEGGVWFDCACVMVGVPAAGKRQIWDIWEEAETRALEE